MNIYSFLKQNKTKKKIKTISARTKYSWTRYIFAATKQDLLAILNNPKIPEEAREILEAIIETNEWVGQRIIQSIMRGDFKDLEGEELIQKIKEKEEILEIEYQKYLSRDQQGQIQIELPMELYTGIKELDDWLQKTYQDKYRSLLMENLINLKDWYLYQLTNTAAFSINEWQLENAINSAIAWHKKFTAENSMLYAPIKSQNVIMGPDWDGHQEWKGYTVQFIDEQRDFHAEGKNMGHCIASYFGRTIAGNSFNFSIRDPLNRPKATFELDSSGAIVQEQGPYNGSIYEPAATILKFFKDNIDYKKLIQDIKERWAKFSEINKNAIIQDENYGKLLLIENFTDLRAMILNKFIASEEMGGLVNLIYIMDNNKFFIKDMVFYRILDQNNNTIGIVSNFIGKEPSALYTYIKDATSTKDELNNISTKEQDYEKFQNNFLTYIQNMVDKLNKHVLKRNFNINKISSDSDFQLFCYYIVSIPTGFEQIKELINNMNKLNEDAITAIYNNVIENSDVNLNHLKENQYFKKLKNLEKIIISIFDGSNTDYSNLFEFIILNKQHKWLPNITIPAEGDRINLLICAIKMNDIQSFKYLLENYNFRINPDEISGKCIPIIEAIKIENLEMIKILVEKGASLNKDDYTSTISPLEHAYRNGNIEIIQFLYSMQEKIDTISLDTSALLESAIYSRKIDSIKFLLNKKIDLNKISKNGLLPLNMAIKSSRIEIIDLLLKNGADPNKKDNRYGMPLRTAVIFTNLEITKLLIHYGANVNMDDMDEGNIYISLITEAVLSETTNKNERIVPYLIKQGININSKSKISPLSMALQHNRLDIFKLLIEKGADLYTISKDSMGKYENILDCAIKLNKLEYIKVLIKAGIDLDKLYSQEDKNKLLFYIIYNNSADILKLFLELGLDPNQENIDNNEIPIISVINHRFYRSNRIEMGQLLIDYGANVDKRSQDGRIPLIEAINNEKEDFIKLLINNNADVNIIDDSFDTPLIHAIRKKNPTIVKLILRAGGDSSILSEKERMFIRTIMRKGK